MTSITAMTPMTPTHRSHGFTLVELTITMLLVSWIMVMMAQVLLESAHLSREVLEDRPSALLELAHATIRRDVQTAVSVQQNITWSDSSLSLRLSDSDVRYSLIDGNLIRQSQPHPGAQLVGAPSRSLGRLADFRWRTFGSLVEIEWLELSRSVNRPGQGWIMRPARLGDHDPRPQRLVIASRRLGVSRW